MAGTKETKTTGAIANNELKNLDPIQEEKNSVQQYMRKMRTNKVELGAELIDIRVQEGNVKTDKTTGQPILNQLTGEPEKWKTKYIATFAFMGDSIEIDLSNEQYSNMNDQIGMPYYLTGRLKKKKFFVDGSALEVSYPHFTSFSPII